MEVIFVRNDFSESFVIDHFKSLIWTDRYWEAGDFEMYVEAEANLLDNFEIGMYVMIRDSDRIMVIESLEVETDIEEGNFLKISGRSAEAILDRRIIWKKKKFNGLLQDGLAAILNENMLVPADEDRKIDVFRETIIDNTNSYYKVIDYEWDGDNIYDTICELCQVNNLGFKVTIDDENKFNIEFYVGKNRGWDQREYGYVIFSPRYENLISTDYLNSIEDYKNVTLIGGEENEEKETRFYTSVGEASGLDRYEIFTDSSTSRPELEDEIPVYRVYNKNTGAHYYILGSDIDIFTEAGWTNEGLSFVVSSNDGTAVRKLVKYVS